MTLTDWLNKNFQVTSISGNEVQFPCPKCKHPAFYFNIKIKVGYCHRNTCHFKPDIKGLNKYAKVKASGGLSSILQAEQSNIPVVVADCRLPASAMSLVIRVGGKYISNYQEVVNHVEKRGVTIENQYQFNLQWDGNRVYIPIYFDGKLVNYVGRAAWWKDTTLRRYQYFPGAKTREFIFNWDAVNSWDSVVLVENTFNGIWLNNYFRATSNFGSDLSVKQIELIASSKLKKVVFLWDEGAEWAAGRARDRLKPLGIASTILKIQGQPDNYTAEQLKPWVEFALQNIAEKAIINTCQPTK